MWVNRGPARLPGALWSALVCDLALGRDLLVMPISERAGNTLERTRGACTYSPCFREVVERAYAWGGTRGWRAASWHVLCS